MAITGVYWLFTSSRRKEEGTMAVKTQTISMQDDLLNEIKIKAQENQRSISAEIAYRVKISLKTEKEREHKMT